HPHGQTQFVKVSTPILPASSETRRSPGSFWPRATPLPQGTRRTPDERLTVSMRGRRSKTHPILSLVRPASCDSGHGALRAVVLNWRASTGWAARSFEDVL